ncbi:5-carboxymethyl-2-hydroxymuconate Delta-isomerase [Vibrio palustris]|uniref:5-carboxymethyl-2-hydroxymuconate Delta-isomerase n=1 Tax=Vibrio palustris TaxID=1918946 RepID=A0A1R4B768_9VIBR|nr:5-carboxymethyl-2-hydroxymuconate Delta-isomerase [Vibrio palustris]SJL84736.1 5-carboxymethyl-2-hydroxymuconate Delta-isomerase [Vibrio palustris]
MPNLIMEYSDSVDERVNVQKLLEDLHQLALDCGLFAKSDVKSRAIGCHDWLIGEEQDSQDFIHLTVEMLFGRTQEQKRTLGEQLMAVLQQEASNVRSLSLNMRDMDRETFIKVIQST